MSSLRFIIKQQWTIEEIYIFSNISHLERRVDLSDTNLKETHPKTIPARFGLIRFRGYGLYFVQKFFSNKSQNIYFFCRAKRECFFQKITLGYMIKTLNQIIFFSSTKIRIFFQQHWESEYFFRKKTIPTLEVKWSVPYSLCNLYSTSPPYSEVLTDIYLFFSPNCTFSSTTKLSSIWVCTYTVTLFMFSQ